MRPISSTSCFGESTGSRRVTRRAMPPWLPRVCDPRAPSSWIQAHTLAATLTKSGHAQFCAYHILYVFHARMWAQALLAVRASSATILTLPQLCRRARQARCQFRHEKAPLQSERGSSALSHLMNTSVSCRMACTEAAAFLPRGRTSCLCKYRFGRTIWRRGARVDPPTAPPAAAATRW